MSAKPTPGPWIVCMQDDDERCFTVFAQSQLEGGLIKAGAWDDYVVRAGLNHPNFEANARLAAASWELLTELQKLLAAYRALAKLGHSEDDAYTVGPHNAIAKATGETA